MYSYFLHFQIANWKGEPSCYEQLLVLVYVVHKKQISIPNLVFALLHFIFNNVYLMVTNWCVDFLILIYKKEFVIKYHIF